MFQEETDQKHENESVFSKVRCVNKLSHSNFIRGPLLIASEGLTLIAVATGLLGHDNKRWGGRQKQGFCSYVSSICDEELRPT